MFSLHYCCMMLIGCQKNLSTFTNLKILSIQSNRITKMEGLEALVNLQDLYLSHNGLKKIEGLEHNVCPAAPD